ncbi:MAG: amidohydrolase family protein, partial [Dehalococcoidia bacterium]|nr:amidohydrolase family protein [Dehalococcoidia bacterium]
MIVDSHSHILVGRDMDALAEIGGPAMGKITEFVRGIIKEKPQTTDLNLRLAQLDKFGIDYQLATLMPSLNPNNVSLEPENALKISKLINDGMASITRETGGRIVCTGNISMEALNSGGLDEMERAFKDLGLRGFGMPTHVRGKPVDAPEFRPFWAKASEMGAPVYLHPVDPINKKDRSYEADFDLIHVFGWPFETTLAMCRLVFSGIMEEYDNLEIVTHHLGGMVPYYWARIEECYIPQFEPKTGVRLKRPLKELFSKFYFDTVIGDNPG